MVGVNDSTKIVQDMDQWMMEGLISLSAWLMISNSEVKSNPLLFSGDDLELRQWLKLPRRWPNPSKARPLLKTWRLLFRCSKTLRHLAAADVKPTTPTADKPKPKATGSQLDYLIRRNRHTAGSTQRNEVCSMSENQGFLRSLVWGALAGAAPALCMPQSGKNCGRTTERAHE